VADLRDVQQGGRLRGRRGGGHVVVEGPELCRRFPSGTLWYDLLGPNRTVPGENGARIA
jgi:hypothetical protein